MARSLLFRELGLSNLFTTKYNIEHALHGAQQLLIRRGSAALKVCDYGGRGVTLGGKVLLCHCSALVVLGFGARLGDGLADNDADCLGLDDIVGAVDFGKTLAFLTGSCGSLWTCVGKSGASSHGWWAAYRVGRSVLLLCGNDATASLCSIQCRPSFDNSLTGPSGAATGAATNLSDGVPVVRHVEGGFWALREKD